MQVKLPCLGAHFVRPDPILNLARLRCSCRVVKPVDVPVYVAGNHEAYGMTLEDAEAEIRQATLQHMDVHFLNCEEVVIDDVRFLGCTLWTDFCLFGDSKRWGAMIDAREAMSVYQRIRRKSDFRKLHPADTEHLHTQHKAWLRNRLEKPTTAPAAVVITHLAASMLSVAKEYAANPVCCFCFQSR